MKKINPNPKNIIVSRKTDNIFKNHGWPSVCVDDRGVVYAVCSGHRLEHVCPAGKDLMFVSFNGGETWTRPIIVEDSYLDDRDAGIIYLGNGKLLMSWFTEWDTENYARFQDYEWMYKGRKALYKGWAEMLMDLPEEERRDGSYVKISEDYGVTWSDRIRVPVSAPHGPNVMKDGTIIYLGRAQNGDCGEDEHRIIAFASEDGGYTWKKRGIVPHPSDLMSCDAIDKEHITDYIHEPHVVELPNGRLLGAMRVHCRPAPFEPSDTVYTTFSDDGGYTWSDPKCVGVEGLPPHLMVHSSGAVILSYGCRTPGKWDERACVSYDNGETWTEDYDLHPNTPDSDLGYPATAELPDGSLISVYYQKGAPEDWLASIICSKWKLEEHE